MNTKPETPNPKPAPTAPASAVALAHHFARLALRPGDLAVDATAGNGHDTVFLAGRVGDTGKVFAFDVQEAAIQSARARAKSAGLSSRIEFFHEGHECLSSRLRSFAGKIQVVMFNLGYLPGGDKSIVTGIKTTVAALDAAMEILAPGGRITIVAYPGHPGGAEESHAVRSWTKRLPKRTVETFACELLAPGKPPPVLHVIDFLKS